MNRKEIKKELRKILEGLPEMIERLEDLKMEVEETAESIEPYEYKEDLTPQQEERREWLENLAYALDDFISSLEANELEEYTEEY